jgi:hypothetical protein
MRNFRPSAINTYNAHIASAYNIKVFRPYVIVFCVTGMHFTRIKILLKMFRVRGVSQRRSTYIRRVVLYIYSSRLKPERCINHFVRGAPDCERRALDFERSLYSAHRLTHSSHLWARKDAKAHLIFEMTNRFAQQD